MSELKTQPTPSSVEEFIESISGEQKRAGSRLLLDIMERVTGSPPQMWGEAIVGFGRYHYRYASGREGDWFLTGFSPRKESLTVYLSSGFEHFPAHMARLGRYKTGKSCLYIKKMEDIDLGVLEELVRASVEHMRRTNPAS
jgi:hypothetical protein